MDRPAVGRGEREPWLAERAEGGEPADRSHADTSLDAGRLHPVDREIKNVPGAPAPSAWGWAERCSDASSTRSPAHASMIAHQAEL